MITEQKVWAYSAQMEQAKKLDPALLQLIYEQGWFKLFVPEELGGRMMPLPEALLVFEEASRMDGNLGWLVTIGAGGGMFAGYLQPDAAQTLLKPKTAVIAGSGNPSGIARKVEGGYIVTGQWKYCSGSSYATMFTANCRVAEEETEENGDFPIRSFVFLPEQVEILPDWKAFGLKATESHSIKVDRIFVPDERTFDLSEQKGFWECAIYRYPFLAFAETSFAAVTLGLARHFLDEAAALSEQNKDAWDAASNRRYPFVRERIDQMDAQWSAARNTFYQVVRDSWRKVESGGVLEEQEQHDVGRVSKQTARTSVQCARELFTYLGMNAVKEDSPINRIWRDLHTVSQHILLASFELDRG